MVRVVFGTREKTIRLRQMRRHWYSLILLLFFLSIYSLFAHAAHRRQTPSQSLVIEILQYTDMDDINRMEFNGIYIFKMAFELYG